MKTSILILSIIISCLNFSACGNQLHESTEQQLINMDTVMQDSIGNLKVPLNENIQDSTVLMAIKRVKDFYTEYITETSKVPVDSKKVDLILKKYCTIDVQKQLKVQGAELDYDLLIDNQYCEEEWLKTMEISKDDEGNVYIVKFKYLFDGKEEKKLIKLQVIKQEEIYFINKILID